jgi:hypothetical protein
MKAGFEFLALGNPEHTGTLERAGVCKASFDIKLDQFPIESK